MRKFSDDTLDLQIAQFLRSDGETWGLIDLCNAFASYQSDDIYDSVQRCISKGVIFEDRKGYFA